MKQQLKKITPAPLWKVGSDAYWWYHNRGRHRLAQAINPVWAASRHRLEGYRDAHAGERCFILGNGPSLRRTDLSLLRDEFTFGLNRIYLLFHELGFPTSCLVSVNDLVLEQCATELRSLDLPKFVTWRARRWFEGDPRTTFLDTDFTAPETFSGEATRRLFEGHTVTFAALQLAYFMGFTDVILVGVDHNFETKGQANLAITSEGDDPNHFAPNYFGKGFRWQLPDLEGSERSYRLAKAAFEGAGRQVRDATIGGKLTIFPKVPYPDLFSKD
jgi:hypothetical protein